MAEKVDYMSVLRRQVDEQVRRWIAQVGQPPHAIILSKSQYTLLEDYCIAREVTSWITAITRWAQATSRAKPAHHETCRTIEERLTHLRKDGVVYLTCNAGNLRIRVSPGADGLELV